MISLFKNNKSTKPLTKAVYALDEQPGAKWVPLNKSFITLMSMVLHTAAERIGISHLAVTLRCIHHQGYRHLLLAGDDLGPTGNAMGLVEEFIITNDHDIAPATQYLNSEEGISVPIDYQGQRLGYLLATIMTDDFAEEKAAQSPRLIESELDLVVAEINSIVTRYQTRHRAIFIYGDQHYWIGNSAALHQVDMRIEHLKNVRQPVLIRGNKGTGKAIAARSLHCCRHQGITPFIESSCNEWQEGAATSVLQALYSYAKGGTLYLRNVDTLSHSNFRVLQRFWARLKREYATKSAEDSVSIIFSVSGRQFLKDFEIAAWLKENTLELQLPDLVERKGDLRDLVSFFIKEYKLSVDFDFTEHAWRLLESYSWRENVDQLKRVIQKVALVADEPLISVSLLEPLIKEW
ncbi:sigma 54-interacting transcriptional regulator [Cellvibrio sp.]|uniref:sigma 54-interacting transcriptional regulator n=1 Tax=Cellvibrio sp. TaxID=1965322 RepID=UPI00396486F9